MFSYLTSSMYTQYCPLNQSKANQKLSGSSEYCISVSAMDALQWMGAVRMRADKNITIIHTTPVHKLPSGEDKSLHEDIFTLNHCFWAKYKSIISP